MWILRELEKLERISTFQQKRISSDIGNTRNRPIWHVYPIQSANPVWTFLLFGSLFSAMILATHKAGQYDLIDSLSVFVRF
jgi:hypothetical protein